MAKGNSKPSLSAAQKTAAKEMGFSNVNKQSEVKRINDYIASKASSPAPAAGAPAPAATTSGAPAATTSSFDLSEYSKIKLPTGTPGSTTRPADVGIAALSPLGGYDPGAVKMAADYLGIKTPNKKSEINRIQALLDDANSTSSRARGVLGGVRTYDSYNDYFRTLGGGVGIGGGAGGTGGAGGASANDVKNDGSYASIKSLYQKQFDDAAQAQADFRNQMAEKMQAMQLDMDQQIADTKTAADQQINYLNSLMLQQQQQAQSTQSLLQQQAQAAQAAYAEQARQAQALASAYVPALESSAMSAQLGDQRSSDRQTVNNTLSSLAIASPSLGANVNPLAGLQLA